MIDTPEQRPFPLPPRGARKSGAAAEVAEPAGGTVAISTVARAVRRRWLVALVVAAYTSIAAILAFQAPASYRATAVLRLTGERQAVSAGVEQASAPVDRSSAPLLSLVPRIRSRHVVGRAVDSLGLQLQAVPPSAWERLLGPPATLPLRDVRVLDSTAVDTLGLTFAPNGVAVASRTAQVVGGYGRPVKLGPVQFTVSAPPAIGSAVVTVVPRDVAIDRVLDRLAVVPVTGTDVLEIRYTDPDPTRAQQVANAILTLFRGTTIRSSQERAARRREFLADQLKETDRLLARAQGSLSGFRARRQLANSSDKIAAQQAAVLTLDTRRGELEADRRVYRSLLAQLETTNDSAKVEGLRTLAYSPEIATDPIVGRLYQQLLVYRTRLDSLTTGDWRSASTNPDVVQLNALLRSAQGELVRAIRAHLRSIQERSSALAAVRSASAESLRVLPAFQAEEERLGQQVASLSTLIDQLRLEYQKSRMSEALEAGDIEVVDLAALPYQASGVPWWLKIGLALLIGTLLGPAAATIMEMRDRAIRGPDEMERLLQVRGLGVIPPVAEAAPLDGGFLRSRMGLKGAAGAAGADALPIGIVGDSQWSSPGAEAFRLLYSSLTVGWGERRRTVIVTSVAPQEGKTLIAANLAVTFAREGARVLLVDCDLRRPRLHKVFGVPAGPGLMELLAPPRPVEPEVMSLEDDRPPAHSYSMFAGVERPSESPRVSAPTPNGVTPRPVSAPAPVAHGPVRPTKIPRLSFLPCGKIPRNPAEALKLGRLREVLDDVGADFDLIILDTPPVLVSADAPILAPMADGVILVLRAGQTDREAAERAHQQLTAAGAYVVGAVLNDPGGEVSRRQARYYPDGFVSVTDEEPTATGANGTGKAGR